LSDRLFLLGLGNPGEEYAATRHNAGFMLADAICRKAGFPGFKKQNRSKVALGEYRGTQLLIAKPQTYMNLSGDAVLSLMTTHRFTPAEMLVVVDDLALPFEKIRFRPGGGDGGHNGLKSIIEKLGRNDFSRLRIGIGSPPPEWDPADYVLSVFSPGEREQLPSVIERCLDGIDVFIAGGIDEAMNQFN
jgi:PTH1 family peptidyl-tRNA hydrolase